MTQREPPKPQHDLFPSTWIVGQAAASLAKEDDGVLLADEFRDPWSEHNDQPSNDSAGNVGSTATAEPLPAPTKDADGVLLAEAFRDPLAGRKPHPLPEAPVLPVDSSRQAAADVDADAVPQPAVDAEPVTMPQPGRESAPSSQTVADSHPEASVDGEPVEETSLPPSDPTSPSAREQEMAELLAENERLLERVKTTRERLQPMSRRIDAINAELDQSDDTDAAGLLPLDSEPVGLRSQVGHPPMRRGLILVLMLLVVVSLGATWFAAQRLDTYEGNLPQRVAALSSDLAAGIDREGLTRRASTAWDRAVRYADQFGERIAAAWADLVAEPTPPAAATEEPTSAGR